MVQLCEIKKGERVIPLNKQVYLNYASNLSLIRSLT